jgi:hypothetical protein
VALGGLEEIEGERTDFRKAPAGLGFRRGVQLGEGEMGIGVPGNKTDVFNAELMSTR